MGGSNECEGERYALLEKETLRLESRVRALAAMDPEELLSDAPRPHARLGALLAENAKLKHRLAVLKAACQREREGAGPGPGEARIPLRSGLNILHELTRVFTAAILSAFPEMDGDGDLTVATIAVSGNPKFGDYQCNSAMPICRRLRAQGIKVDPRGVGEALAARAAAMESPLIARMEVAPAGFVNVFLDREAVRSVLRDSLLVGIRPPASAHARRRIVVDFSSPNIAKEMHVGHLRSTIIGDGICRLLEFLGHDVLRLNHVGDWGTQFGMLIAHLEDEFPDYSIESPPISDLQSFYKSSKARFDEDPEFKKRAYSCVVRLQAFDEKYVRAWNLICEVSRREFRKIYDRLGIRITERGESYYQKAMETMVEELKRRELLEEDDGRWIMWGEGGRGSSVPLTIVKSDGGFTYDTSDMACIRQRVEEERADRLVYVTDAGQATHFEVVESCARRAGYLGDGEGRSVAVQHVGFGVVLGEDGKKFKTRSGDSVKLTDLLDEGLRRARETLLAKGRDAALTAEELEAATAAIAYGCIKYADLSRNRNNEYVFSFDRMLEDRGNTAVYLLYAYARIGSIARTAGLCDEDLRRIARETAPSVSHDREWKLAKTLARLPEVAARVSVDLCLHALCEYVYEVSTAFTEFYDSCYCIEKNSAGEVLGIDYGRILLCEVTAKTMAQCFSILGLNPVSKM